MDPGSKLVPVVNNVAREGGYSRESVQKDYNNTIWGAKKKINALQTRLRHII